MGSGARRLQAPSRGRRWQGHADHPSRSPSAVHPGDLMPRALEVESIAQWGLETTVRGTSPPKQAPGRQGLRPDPGSWGHVSEVGQRPGRGVAGVGVGGCVSLPQRPAVHRSWGEGRLEPRCVGWGPGRGPHGPLGSHCRDLTRTEGPPHSLQDPGHPLPTQGPQTEDTEVLHGHACLGDLAGNLVETGF